MIRGNPHRVSIRTRVFKTMRWILIRSLIVTVLLGLLPNSIPRKDFEGTSSDRSGHILALGYYSSGTLFPDDEGGESYHVRTHGIPWFFFVSDSSAHHLTTPVLFCRFAIDWAFWFGFFVAIFVLLALLMLLMECINLTAFYAARCVRALRSDHSNRKP